jgi:hypothetical protein
VFDAPSEDPSDDIAFAEAMNRASTRPLLAAMPTRDGRTLRPISIVAREGRIAYDATVIDERGLPEVIPSTEAMPSMAAQLANTPNAGSIRIDWSIDRDTIPVVSAIDVLAGRAGSVRGYKVLIASTAPRLGGMHTTPTGEQLPGGYIIALAARAQVGAGN